jgi:protein-tyrosine phosphatase
MSFVDLHSHVLFGLDDGSPDLATSLVMLEGLRGLGFAEVCATPHQKAGHFLPSAEVIARTYAELIAAVAAPPPGTRALPRVRLAAENMWDDVLFGRIQQRAIPSYSESPAFLMELRPAVMPVGLIDQAFRLRMEGRVPVLAHPERYQALWDDDALATSLRRQCAFQIDLPALAGYHGRKECKAARRLVEKGLATAASSDAHTPEDVRHAAEGIAWIEKKLGAAAVDRLLGDAPRALLAGDLPD